MSIRMLWHIFLFLNYLFIKILNFSASSCHYTASTSRMSRGGSISRIYMLYLYPQTECWDLCVNSPVCVHSRYYSYLGSSLHLVLKIAYYFLLTLVIPSSHFPKLLFQTISKVVKLPTEFPIFTPSIRSCLVVEVIRYIISSFIYFQHTNL